MPTRRRRIEKLDDADFSDGLGNSHPVELVNNRYTRRVVATITLGDAYETDSKNTSVDWDADAEERFFESIKLNANGEIFDVPSEYVNFLNTFENGVEKTNQVVVSFRVPYEYNGKTIATGEVRGSDFSTLRVEFDTRTVSDLTSDAVTPAQYQENTEVEIVAKEATSGSTMALPKVNDKVDNFTEGQNHMEIKQDGEYDFLVLEDPSDVLDDIKVEVNVPGDEIEVIDMSSTALRNRNIQNAGTTQLPSGRYFVNLSEDDRFDSSNVNSVDVEAQATGSGKVTSRTQTTKEV